MKKSEIRSTLRNILLTRFDYVESEMEFPDERANLQGDFPYITMVFSSWTPQGVSLYGTQSVSIIGITNGDQDTLSSRIDEMENDIISLLYKNGHLQLNVTEVDNNNLFKPYGLEAGLFLPYGGVRVELEIPNVKLKD